MRECEQVCPEEERTGQSDASLFFVQKQSEKVIETANLQVWYVNQVLSLVVSDLHYQFLPLFTAL